MDTDIAVVSKQSTLQMGNASWEIDATQMVIGEMAVKGMAIGETIVLGNTDASETVAFGKLSIAEIDRLGTPIGETD